jgi:MOSC domain-containing protein YiiM
MQPPAASASPLPRGIVTAVCRRPLAATGDDIFERLVHADGVPVPLGPDGLEGSQEWHRLEKNAGKLSSADASDRAILMQALHPASAAPLPRTHLTLTSRLTTCRQCESHAQRLLHIPHHRLAAAIQQGDVAPGAFGENLRVRECEGSAWDTQSLCIGAAPCTAARPVSPTPTPLLRHTGDVIVVERAAAQCSSASSATSTVTVACLQVSSPRRPCSRVDLRFGRTFTAQGVRAEAARTGAAGIMLRVLQTGSIAVGDVLRVLQRPHPSWSVCRAAALLYGHPTACMMYSSRNVKLSEWMGSVQELREVCTALLPATVSESFITVNSVSAACAATARRLGMERSSAVAPPSSLPLNHPTLPCPSSQLRGMLNETPSSSPFVVAAAFAAAGAFVALQVTTPHTAAYFTLIIVSTRSSNPDRRKKCKPATT